MREYDGQVCYNDDDYIEGYETKIFNNICVVPMGSDGTPNEMVGHTGSACTSGKTAGVLQAFNNSYYTPQAAAVVGCSGGPVNLTAVTPPFEVGSTSNPMPSTDQIIAWGRSKILP